MDICVNCNHQEGKHDYSPPQWGSSDGLPTFEGCYGAGVKDPANVDFPEPVCDCTEYEPSEQGPPFQRTYDRLTRQHGRNAGSNLFTSIYLGEARDV